ncbi:MAG: hypothetical protein ACRCZ0_03945 [Cetobacterium sp.]
MKKISFIFFIFTIVLIKSTYKSLSLIKYVQTSTDDKKVQFEVLMIKRS